MKCLDQLENLHLEASFLTIGAFDGLHRGHQKLLQDMAQAAHRAGVPAVALTFHPHPAVVLRDIQTPQYLTSPEEKKRLMALLGIDWLITLPFTRELAAEPARSFVARLWNAAHMQELWVGHDFALGHNREGTPELLRQIGAETGFSVNSVLPLEVGGLTVSSSQVRALVSQGEMRAVAELLGRPYGFTGLVVHGEGRGHTLGIPTANLEPWKGQLVPRTGVYATRTCLEDGRWLTSVTNIGYRPTFDTPLPEPRVEALLLGEVGDIYGTHIRLDFVEFIRPETRFASVDELLAQIARDAEQAKELASHEQ